METQSQELKSRLRRTKAVLIAVSVALPYKCSSVKLMICEVTKRASHDEAKRAAETLCFAYQTERKVKIRIARIGCTYGPTMGHCDGSMVSSFMSALVEGVDVQISEPTDATRTILYIDDCVSGLIKLMNSSYTAPINISGDDVLSVKGLFEQLKSIVANYSNAIPWKEVSFFPETGSRKPANAAAFVNLDWFPKVKAKEGLTKTVQWYKEDKARRLVRAGG